MLYIKHPSVHVVGEGPSPLLIQERVREAFRQEDEARLKYLNDLIKYGTRCRYCGAEVQDERLKESPGVCSRKRCREKAAAGQKGRVLVFVRSRRAGGGAKVG